MLSRHFGMFVLRTSLAVATILQTSAYGQLIPTVNPHEREFIKGALASSRKIVAVADLAMSQGADPMVRSLAQMIVYEHIKSNTSLEEIARKKGIETNIAAEFDTRLGSLKGQEFDRALLQKIVESHTDEIERCKQAEKSITDGDLRDYIAALLPMLQGHLEQAKALTDEKVPPK